MTEYGVGGRLEPGIPAQWRNFSSGNCCFGAPHQPSQDFLRAALQSKALSTQFFFLPAPLSWILNLDHDLRPSPLPLALSPLSLLQALSPTKVLHF